MCEGQTGESGDLAYGCAFCLTGKEEWVAGNMMKACPEIRATPAKHIKRKTRMGITRHVEAVLFPGYVFFKVPDRDDLPRGIFQDGVISVLKSSERSWKMYGKDMEFARWLFSYNGLIGFSKAYMEGERIRIASGPLLDLEGKILKIDKRNKSGQVGLTFDNKVIKVWLGFEFIESTDEKQAVHSIDI